MKPLNCLVGIVLASLIASGAQAQPELKKNQKIIQFLIDTSATMATQVHRNKVVCTHYLKIAETSDQPILFLAIFFGGQNEVKVVGDGNGNPTAAYKTFWNRLLTVWPKPSGNTPMDRAMKEAANLIRREPIADHIVIQMADGTPESGMIRPKEFPEIDKPIKKLLLAEEKRLQGFPLPTIQRRLNRMRESILNRESEDGKKIYRKQLELEFAQTLKIADEFKKAGVRFVTVDFAGGLKALAEIHEAAGGKAKDLILAHPAKLIVRKLHEVGLTAMSNLIVQKDITIPAHPNSFEKSTPIPIEPIGDKVLVTIDFDDAIPDFTKNALLKAEVDGRTYTFDPKNNDPTCTLSTNSNGSVATAHLLLDRKPKGGEIVLHYQSPQQTWSVPAATVYVHLKIPNNLTPIFRPNFLAPDTMPPYRIAPPQPVQWLTRLAVKNEAKAYAVKAIEAVAHPRHGGQRIRIDLAADQRSPHQYIGPPKRFPRGVYDVELSILTEQGGQMRLSLPKHFESQDRDERLLMAVKQPAGDDNKFATKIRSHLGFPELGDESTKQAIEVDVRTEDIDYPIEVEPRIVGLTDHQGNVPKHEWFRFSWKKLRLEPGRLEKLLVWAEIPSLIEEEIVDGPIEAKLHFIRTDTQQSIPVERLQPIAGVADDESVNRVTFHLRRPKFDVSIPRCFGNDVVKKNGEFVTTIDVDVHKRFERIVTVNISHDSKIARTITAKPAEFLVDGQGKQIFSARLIRSDDCELTQEVEPGQSGTWAFVFVIDDDANFREGLTEFDISAPGLRPLRIKVAIAPRRPLLGNWIWATTWSVFIVSLLIGGYHAINWLKARRCRPGGDVRLASNKSSEFLEIRKRKQRTRLFARQLIKVRHGNGIGNKFRPVREDRPIEIDPKSISSRVPLDIEYDNRIYRFTDFYGGDAPELHGFIERADHYQVEATRRRRKMVKWLTISFAVFGFALLFFTMPVLRITQWCVEFLGI